MTDVYTQIPYDEFTSRVMKSLIPSIRIQTRGEAIDRVVNYEVKSTPDSDYASCPFDGSMQDGLAYDLTVAQPEGLTLTIAKVAALAPVANTPYLATTAVGGIGVASQRQGTYRSLSRSTHSTRMERPPPWSSRWRVVL